MKKSWTIFDKFLIAVLFGWVLLIALFVSAGKSNASDTIWLPNLGQQMTGTTHSGHYGSDVWVQGGTVAATLATLPVFQFLDSTPVLDTSVTNIPGSGGTALTVVSSLTQNVSRLRVSDTTGQYIGVYEGSSLRFVINPGLDDSVDVNMTAGSAVKLKAIGSSAITSGSVVIQFM